MPPRQRIVRPDGWQPADPPRWRSDLDLTSLTRRPPVVPLGSFAGVDAAIDTGNLPRLSAVLIALTDAVPGRAGVHVLLTRRADHLRTHAGEVSFPGGRVDPDEPPDAAALREAWEEVALEPGAVEVHGELPHVHTFLRGSHIVPVVGVVARPPALVASPAEVDEAYWVPLDALVVPGVHHRELWRYGADALPMEFFELADDTIWGATARMLVTLLAAHDSD